MPCLDGVIYFFLTIGVKLGDRVGVRNTVILSFILFYLSYFILIFAKNFFLFLISMVMFGIAHAISNLSVIKNVWKYFPNNTGLVYGIIVSGAGMCSSIFTPLADFVVINPEKEKTNDDGFYPEYIAHRLLKYLIIVTGILSIFGALSCFFTFDKKNKKEEKVEIIGKINDDDEDEENKDSLIENKKDDEKENNNNSKDNENKEKALSRDNKRLFEALKSTKNLMFVGFCFGSFCKY
jgi:MFS family permease